MYKEINMINAMWIFYRYFSRPASLEQLSLKTYQINYSLDALLPGVDNIHIDVNISPKIQNTVKQLASLLMIKHSQMENLFPEYNIEKCEAEKNALRNICTDILQEGINIAKAISEVQIDFLAQTSIIKIFIEEIKNQYELFIHDIEYIIRTHDLSQSQHTYESFKLKEKLADIKYNKTRLLIRVGKELFRIIININNKTIQNIRESNFKTEFILPEDFFLNPMLITENVVDDIFLIEAYALFGQRSEDPDNYHNLKELIYDLLDKTDINQKNIFTKGSIGVAGREEKPEMIYDKRGHYLDPLIMEVENVNQMFNYFSIQQKLKRAISKKEPQDIIDELRTQTKIKEKLLNYFYYEFEKRGVLKRIIAAYEMISIYRNYCPPMRPRQIREFIVNPATRRSTLRQMKGRKSASLLPLYKKISQIKKCTAREMKQCLLRFLKHFSQYHRDLNNKQLLKYYMEKINIIKEDKILRLSRENRSLYEFLLPDEKIKEDKPVINHTIIKADIRGSVDITYTMRKKGLNPASYFSLNFFEPISEILYDYGGFKEFIEGDAIILSIFEYEDTPHGWYGVARACGLAIRIINIVEQYNIRSHENDLPILELGIGICFNDSHPAFLFDEDSRIIISPAINLADRLSGCNKMLRERLKNRNKIFNLFVYEDFQEKQTFSTADDISLRYNVNGIELSQDGFVKLSKEINLIRISYKIKNDETITLYTGKVPTLTGKNQRIVIREADILKIDLKTMDITDKTTRKYYEVCTNPEIYEYIRSELGT